ncbi:MAG TPA: hypothetical protein VJ804_09800 [Acidimicrobiales bacterium]|nr:hypothetical protein [Acidimicrobiales bacterium]
MTGFIAGLALAAAVVLPGAPAQDDEALQIDATIAGVDVATADTDDPILLDPREEIPLRLTIRNLGDEPEEIRHVRLEGKALGLTFLTYDIGIRTTLDPGESTTVDTALDFFDLERQATGYLGTSLRVYDTDGRVIGDQTFVVDVRGDATSTLGIFAMVVLVLAVFSSAVLVINTARRRLPSNRFVRALQFAIAGSAIGVTLSLGVSILRIAFADVEAWAPLVFIPTVVAFFVGYIAPGPLQRSIRDYQAEEALQGVARAAVARATGSNEAVGGPDARQRSGPQEIERTPAGD